MSSKGSGSGSGEERDGVSLTNLDQELFPGAGATKRELVDYLDAVSERIIPALRGRPLSVMRVLRGQKPFMQKNVPKYTPSWVQTVPIWSEASNRKVSYALCDDRKTLLWFANQRAVEYHPGLVLADRRDRLTHMVLDLDPPEGSAFSVVVATALLVREALASAGLEGAVKTSGAKGVHIFVPVDDQTPIDELAGATRALAARAAALDPSLATTAFIVEDRGGRVFVDSTRSGPGGTVVAAYSPRLRPGVPVSFPVAWDELENIKPADFTIHTAAPLLGDTDPWAERLPKPQSLPADLVEEGRSIPIARVQAMHEGKRRKRAAEAKQAESNPPETD
jgi:bifunctional non-homologous end joining protein LigD